MEHDLTSSGPDLPPGSRMTPERSAQALLAGLNGIDLRTLPQDIYERYVESMIPSFHDSAFRFRLDAFRTGTGAVRETDIRQIVHALNAKPAGPAQIIVLRTGFFPYERPDCILKKYDLPDEPYNRMWQALGTLDRQEFLELSYKKLKEFLTEHGFSPKDAVIFADPRNIPLLANLASDSDDKRPHYRTPLDAIRDMLSREQPAG